MIIKKEISSFDEFEAWSGGYDTLKDLTPSQKERLFEYAEELFFEGCTDTELNDWLWFDRDMIYEHLNIDEDGNDIGSVEWARKVLMEYAESKSIDAQFGNIYSLLSTYLDEEYCDGDHNTEYNLQYSFDSYILVTWREFMKQQLMAWHSELGAELIMEWLEENYDDEQDVPYHEDVIEEFGLYAQYLDNETNEDD